ncbi:MAG: hypothetical protein KJO43_01010, partial [Phycisphaerae bacterium]|nr:hypothetical protein [Phycisphaerae bacterium]
MPPRTRMTLHDRHVRPAHRGLGSILTALLLAATTGTAAPPLPPDTPAPPPARPGAGGEEPMSRSVRGMRAEETRGRRAGVRGVPPRTEPMARSVRPVPPA